MTDVSPMNVGADIHSVTPQVGSVRGGTVVTITGTGFKVDEFEGIAVDIDGIPCRVCELKLYSGVGTEQRGPRRPLALPPIFWEGGGGAGPPISLPSCVNSAS